MRLKTRTVGDLSEFVTGGPGGSSVTNKGDSFVYRSSSRLTEFFRDCEMDYVHDGTTRVFWTEGVLAELNEAACSNPALPSDAIIQVIQRLMDRDELEESDKSLEDAMARLTRSLSRDSLLPVMDRAGVCQIRAGEVTSTVTENPGWTQKDLQRRAEWEVFLKTASEDEFTAVLVQLLKLMSFQRIEVAGHTDKALEYGKDLWMKYLLPTGHWIYFAIQVKKGKIDAAGKTKTNRQNVSEVLNQVRMALEDEIMDRSMSRKVLVDHVYVVATGEITKQAQRYLVGQLDKAMRRQLIFMDREELLDLLARRSMPIPEHAAS